jgi:hypothetical protein
LAFDLLRVNCMIDLETLATHFDAGVLSIGAVKFDYRGIQDRFYMNVKLSSTKKYNLFIDPDTLRWWNEQKPGIIESMFVKSVPLDVALLAFSEWYGKDSMNTWSNGSAFDQVILRNCYRKIDKKEPWDFWHENCYRTLKGLIDADKKLQPPVNEQLHNAMADAEWQANHMINMWYVWAA